MEALLVKTDMQESLLEYDNIDIREIAKFYINQWGLSVVPLVYGEKRPAIPWKTWQLRRMTTEEVDQYFTPGCNIAIVTGTVSQLVVIDADNLETVDFLNMLQEFKETLQVKTRRGMHFYFRIPDLPPDWGCSKIYNNNIKIDIKANGGYVVAPPSVVKYENKVYSYTWEDKVLHNVNGSMPALKLSFEEFKFLLHKIQVQFTPSSDHTLTLNKQQKEESKKEIKINWEKLKETISKHYIEGKRQDIILYLSGWLKKMGCTAEEVQKFVTELCFEKHDKEIKQRFDAIHYTFNKPNEELKGISGLKEVLGPEVCEDIKKCLKNVEEYETYEIEDTTLENLGFYIHWENNIPFLMLKGKKGRVFYLGPAVRVLCKIAYPEKVAYEISFLNKKFILESVSDTKKIAEITGYNIARDVEYKTYLSFLATRAKTIHIKTYTGWDENMFFNYPLLQNNDLQYWDHFLVKNKLVKKHETAKQHEFVKKVLTEGKILGLLYLAAFSAPLIYLAEGKPAVFFLSGPPGCGKTTSCALATSLFYDGFAATELFSGNASEVGAELLLKNFNDLPILLDEATVSNLDFQKLIYMVFQGTGKVRGTKNLSVLINKFRAVIFVTSELGQQDMKTGAYRRSFFITIRDRKDLTSIPLDMVQEVKSACGAGLDYLNYINSHKDKILKIKLKLKKYSKDLEDIAEISLPLLLCLEVLKDFYGIDLKALEEKLWELLKVTKSKIAAKKDYLNEFINVFTEFVTKHKKNFRTIFELSPQVNEIWGEIEGFNVFILPKVFEKFCQDNKFEINVLLNYLKEAGILKTNEHNRFTVLKRIMGITNRVYHIVLPSAL